AVGRAAKQVIEAVRVQFAPFRKNGVLTLPETFEPDYASVVDIVTKGALRQMVFPGIVVVGMPILTGLVFKWIGNALGEPGLLGAFARFARGASQPSSSSRTPRRRAPRSRIALLIQPRSEPLPRGWTIAVDRARWTRSASPTGDARETRSGFGNDVLRSTRPPRSHAGDPDRTRNRRRPSDPTRAVGGGRRRTTCPRNRPRL